jgi:hypothetical protein
MTSVVMTGRRMQSSERRMRGYLRAIALIAKFVCICGKLGTNFAI